MTTGYIVDSRVMIDIDVLSLPTSQTLTWTTPSSAMACAHCSEFLLGVSEQASQTQTTCSPSDEDEWHIVSSPRL